MSCASPSEAYRRLLAKNPLVIRVASLLKKTGAVAFIDAKQASDMSLHWLSASSE